MGETVKWDQWEFLKLRAELASIAVSDNGTNIEFKTEENDIEMIGLFWREPETNQNTAASWLLARGVNLPGFKPVEEKENPAPGVALSIDFESNQAKDIINQAYRI